MCVQVVFRDMIRLSPVPSLPITSLILLFGRHCMSSGWSGREQSQIGESGRGRGRGRQKSDQLTLIADSSSSVPTLSLPESNYNPPTSSYLETCLSTNLRSSTSSISGFAVLRLYSYSVSESVLFILASTGYSYFPLSTSGRISCDWPFASNPVPVFSEGVTANQ